jgi:hypothetical protein
VEKLARRELGLVAVLQSSFAAGVHRSAEAGPLLHSHRITMATTSRGSTLAYASGSICRRALGPRPRSRPVRARRTAESDHAFVEIALIHLMIKRLNDQSR